MKKCVLCLYSGVEQLAARQPHKLKVSGSSPLPATIVSPLDYKNGGTPILGYSSVGRAADWSG